MAGVRDKSFGVYKRGLIPGDEKDIARVVNEELRKIEEVLNLPVQASVILEEQHAEPLKLYDGMLARADGVCNGDRLGAAGRCAGE